MAGPDPSRFQSCTDRCAGTLETVKRTSPRDETWHEGRALFYRGAGNSRALRLPRASRISPHSRPIRHITEKAAPTRVLIVRRYRLKRRVSWRLCADLNTARSRFSTDSRLELHLGLITQCAGVSPPVSTGGGTPPNARSQAGKCCSSECPALRPSVPALTFRHRSQVAQERASPTRCTDLTDSESSRTTSPLTSAFIKSRAPKWSTVITRA